MNATYVKLKNGSFGIRVVQAEKPKVGSTVIVTTKAGKEKTESIARILFSGDDKYHPGQTVHLCAIEQRSRAERYGRSYRDGEYVRCRFCGKRTPEGDDWCVHCGKAGYEN